jgi:hypothetical protein
LPGCGTYAEAAQAAAFINSIVDQTAQGTWNPYQAAF